MNFDTVIHSKGIVELRLRDDASHLKTKDFVKRSGAWVDSITYGGNLPEIRKSKVVNIDRSTEESAAVDDEIFSLVGKCVEEYTKKYNVVVNFDEGYQILKYETGHYYKKHIDQFTNSRRVSFLLYLNDDYEGGELNFPELNVCIKPKANSVVMFPSDFNYEHESLPVKSGTKYAVVTWLGYR